MRRWALSLTHSLLLPPVGLRLPLADRIKSGLVGEPDRGGPADVVSCVRASRLPTTTIVATTTCAKPKSTPQANETKLARTISIPQPTSSQPGARLRSKSELSFLFSLRAKLALILLLVIVAKVTTGGRLPLCGRHTSKSSREAAGSMTSCVTSDPCQANDFEPPLDLAASRFNHSGRDSRRFHFSRKWKALLCVPIAIAILVLVRLLFVGVLSVAGGMLPASRLSSSLGCQSRSRSPRKSSTRSCYSAPYRSTFVSAQRRASIVFVVVVVVILLLQREASSCALALAARD